VLILVLIVPAVSLQAQDTRPIIGFWDKCPAPTGLPDTVTIGAIFGLSGGTAVYGVPQKQAVQLAVDEVNQSDYLGDKTKLVVNFEDDAGDKTQAINAMTKLVTSDKVIAVIGPTLSSSAFAADPVAQENKTIVIGVSNTAIGLTKMGDFIFRDSLPEAAVIPGTIAQAAKILGLKQVGVLYGNDDDFTKSGYEVFKKALTDNKITIQGEETFARNDVDFNAQLTKLIGNNPDALVVSALAQEAVPIVVQARQLGYNGPIIGGNGFNSPAIAKDGGKAAEGVLIGGAWILGNPNPSKSSVAFVTAYNAAYNANPDQFAAQAYTGAWLLATAIRCGNSVDHTAVRDALAGIKDFESPLGSFSFDENRDPLHQPVVQVIKDGKYVVLAEEPAAGATAEPTASK
jgi:branched-chain amino acid transport system substrate-binding protein